LGGGSDGLFSLLAGAGDRLPVLLHAFPVSTFAGSHGMVILPLQAALTGLTMSSWDAVRCCDLIERHRVDLTYLVPAMAALLLRSDAPQRHDVSSVRVQMWGGSAVPGDVLRALTDRFAGAVQLNIYGLTEGGPAVTMMPYDPANPTSIGRPSGITEVSIRDERNEAVAAGGTGEICLRLPGVPTRRYHRDPESSAVVWTDGWIHTGDIGRQDEAGLLYLVDRVKDLIIRGGHNLSTLEIEEVLLAHPAVAEAAVFGVAHDVLGEDVGAAVVLTCPASEQDLAAHVRSLLSANKVPRRWLLRDNLPRNAMGKALKRVLRAEIEQAGTGPGGPADA
jgi:acyl-CoA synthetase (AMP-forming)/AMP-acid ligase II